MKRVRRIFSTSCSAICLLLIGLLVIAGVKDFRGMQYQRTENRTWPSNGVRYRTPHFYSAGITAWRIIFYEWRDAMWLRTVREERYLCERTLSRSRAIYVSVAGNGLEYQERTNKFIKRIERIDKSHLFDGDGISFAPVELSSWHGRKKTWSSGGIAFQHDSDPQMDSDSHMLTIPVWYLVALLLIMPMLQLWGMWRARKRRRDGFCAACGYDLRASSERCSECGTLVITITGVKS